MIFSPTRRRRSADNGREAGLKKGVSSMKDGKHVILCIDDDQDFLDSLKLILEGGGYAFDSASSAEEGVKKVATARPDLIIVDLMMEEVDAGVNFVKEVKARLGAVPPIYMLSSVGDNLSISADYASLGLSGVLQKPVNPQRLLATLKAKLKA
jgi:DNA-binding response OmpR family regulator